MAADIPALWNAPTTTPADRKEIVRQVIERVVVDAQGTSEQVRVAIEWAGGLRTEGQLIRPVATLKQLSTYPRLCQRVRELVNAGCASAEIARHLDDEGYRPAREGHHFSTQSVRELRRRLGLGRGRPHTVRHDGLGPHEWWKAELARVLGIPSGTLAHWIRRDWVRARQQDEPLRRWVVWADESEQERLRQLYQRSTAGEARRRWTDATGPEAHHG